MNIVNYLKETRAELKHVNWPTRAQSVWYTTVVIILSVLTAAYLGIFDTAFSYLLRVFVGS